MSQLDVSQRVTNNRLKLRKRRVKLSSDAKNGLKIRLGSIRDRWLANVRPYDKEIFVASAFMLIDTKQEI